MSRRAAIVTIIGLCAGFAIGWSAARRQFRNTINRHAPVAVNPQPTPRCDHAPDDQWRRIRLLWYVPVKTLYNVAWEFCSADVGSERVRVIDADLHTSFFEYQDDEILRVETVDFLGDHDPELLIITGSAGTGDDIAWHVISESNGKLHEWRSPLYDDASEKLLRADEDFCCKDWNFHLEGRSVVLARGIYHKGEGNCCPSRGGVLVKLKPAPNAFTVAAIERIDKSDYYRWRSKPFCLECALVSAR